MHDARCTGSASVLIPVPGMVHGTYCSATVLYTVYYCTVLISTIVLQQITVRSSKDTVISIELVAQQVQDM